MQKPLDKKSKLIALKIYLTKYRFKLCFVFIALIISAGATLSLGWTIKYLVNYGLAAKDLSRLTIMALFLALIVIILAGASAIRSYLINFVSENVILDIKQDIYKLLLRTNISYFETHSVADIVSRLVNDTQLIYNVINSVFSFFLRNTIMMVGGICLLFFTNAKLTLYTISIIPLVIIPVVLIAKKVKSLSKDNQDRLSKVSRVIDETLTGIKTVQSNNAELYELQNFIKVSGDYLSSNNRRAFFRSLMIGVVMGLVSLSTILILWLGGRYVIIGEMSGGDLISFVFYSIVVASSVGGMSEVFADISRASGAAERIFELFDLDSNQENGSIKLRKLRYDFCPIEFENVSFSYPSRVEDKLIRNLSFQVNSGDNVSIVGASGSGKTTIVNLLLKFYQPDSGSIKINGHDIREIEKKSLREIIGVVSQETFIFSNTVSYNIAYGDPRIAKSEIVKAAKVANIHDFIMSLPDQYNTHLGEKGAQLSGGQKQRIAIARIIIRNPQILILDEATSNLDEINAEMIQKSLNSIMKNRTTLVISHRESALSNCNKTIAL